MWRQVVELQSLNMGERSGGLEARNAGNRRVRSDVQENLVAGAFAKSSWRNKAKNLARVYQLFPNIAERTTLVDIPLKPD